MTRKPRLAVAAILAAAAPLAVYLMTLAREVAATDSGELAAAAATLGIAHPPGYPLFTLIGWLAARLPCGTVAFRVGLVSAVAAAAAAAVVFRLGLAIGSTAPRPGDGAGNARNGSGDRPSPAPEPSAATVIAALTGAWLLAFGRTLWSQAVVVEVYALQTLLVTLLLAACWRALDPRSDPARAWPLAGVAFGLAAVNHLTGVLLLPSLLATVAVGLGRSGARTPALLVRTAGAIALPLLLTLYLPLRSLAAPPVRWTTIDSLQSFLVHVTARQYHGLWGSRGIRLDELRRFVVDQLPAEATLVLPVLAVIGLVAIARRRPAFALVSALAVGSTLVYNLGYPIHDIAAYYLPVLAVLALWASVGAIAVTGAAARRHRLAALVTATALCATAAAPLVRNWATNDRHDARLIACAIRDTLGPLAPGAVLLTGRWDTVSGPALYAQHVDGQRPDILVLDLGRLSDPQIGRLIGDADPALAAACADELAAAREVGLRAERGRHVDESAGRRSLEALRGCLVAASVDQRPTYVTSDLYRHPMVAGIALSPEGLVARVATRDVFRDVPPAAVEGPCGSRDDLEGPPEKLVWDDYRVAMLNRAAYLRRHWRPDEAAIYERRAAAIGAPPG
jgi:hypothetical protein